MIHSITDFQAGQAAAFVHNSQNVFDGILGTNFFKEGIAGCMSVGLNQDCWQLRTC